MVLKNDKLFQMRTTEGFLKRVDDWRRMQDDLPSRAEAIRRLIEIGLQASPTALTKRLQTSKK
jgi:hypothetical protein